MLVARCFWLLFLLFVVQASVCIPNLPLVVDFWSATFSRSAKGRVVEMDPVSGWLEVFLLCDVRRYSGPEGGAEMVFVVVLVVVSGYFLGGFGVFLLAFLGFFL